MKKLIRRSVMSSADVSYDSFTDFVDRIEGFARSRGFEADDIVVYDDYADAGEVSFSIYEGDDYITHFTVHASYDDAKKNPIRVSCDNGQRTTCNSFDEAIRYIGYFL